MTDPVARSRLWHHVRGSLRLDAPVVMAVLNVTPDSFHDGGSLTRGRDVDLDRVRARAEAAVEAGAGLLDIGGESTRPGADPVDVDEERARVVPAIEAVASLGVPISVDTRRAAVAEAALEAGAVIVNDVSGLQDPQMIPVIARFRAGVAIGHLRGEPKTMQADIGFENLLREVSDELGAAMRRAERGSVPRGHIVVDPGIGFGKRPRQSAALVACGATLQARLGVPVMIGASRKSFIGAVVSSPTQARLPGSLVAAVLAVHHGAAVVRVHDVAETVQALAVAREIEAAYAEAEEGT